MLGVLLCTVLTGLFLYYWYSKTKIPNKFPDGPLGYPIIGYPALGKTHLIQAFEDLHKEYGQVFSVNLGVQKRSVVIGDYETLKDLFRFDTLTPRPPFMQWGSQYFRYGDGRTSRGLMFR